MALIDSNNKPTTSLIFLTVLFFFMLLLQPILSSPEGEVLIRFRDSLTNNGALSNWDPKVAPCKDNSSTWTGIICYKENVFGLQLENLGLQGPLDLDGLQELPLLRTLSFTRNNFDGSFPDFKSLRQLKAIYLSYNKFSGEIPANAFDGMTKLKKLHLDHNQFSGLIPVSLTILPRLIEVMLQNNQFENTIPNFWKRPARMNFSNNQLEGKIPKRLQGLDPSSFEGNAGLCGKPLNACQIGGLSIATIVVIVIVIAAALAGIVAAVIILRKRKQIPQEDREGSVSSVSAHKKAPSVDLDKLEAGVGSPEHHSSSGQKADQSQKLSFLRDDTERFDLSDLLRASAEILGSGVFGSTYKAALNDGQVVVVKRFRQMNNVGREDFQEHMRRLGRLRHPNVHPLVAYYYRKEEKLLVSDYVDNVSLAVQLHGHSQGNPSLDWPTRLKIVKGVAKGLQYLYNELPSLIAPHGHLKSSNVLLNKSYEPLLTDYGLVPITNQEQAQDLMIAYKSPEYKQNNRITKKTDVWSLGILILEILTGKFPANSLQQGKGSDTDLATLVSSLVRDELTNEVFDKVMGGYDKSNEGEMVKLLKIGLSCCESDVDKRLDLKEAVERIEEVKLKEGDEEYHSSYGSEKDIRSRKLSNDFSIG